MQRLKFIDRNQKKKNETHLALQQKYTLKKNDNSHVLN